MSEVSKFIKGNEQQEFIVFANVKTIITHNPKADYYEVNDLVHDKVKEVFGYTHDLRKVYQDHIRFIFKKQNKKFPL